MYQALFHKICESRAHLLLVTLDNLLANIESPSANEREALLEERTFKYYLDPKNFHTLRQFYDEYDNDEDIRLLFDFEASNLRFFARNGIILLADTSSKYYNVVNNCRVTTDQPDSYATTVYLFGHCNAVGCHTEDKHTAASRLQRGLNSMEPNSTRVVNAANWTNFNETARQIISHRYAFKEGDIVIILQHDASPEICGKKLRYFSDTSFFHSLDLSRIFQRPHNNGEVLFDKVHMAHRGYAMVAEHLLSAVRQIREEQRLRPEHGDKALAPYLNYLALLKKRRPDTAETVGAIVMNGNPFTLGHRYLAEEALKRCDYLYVFILDEDKSFFSFDARMAMAKAGLKDLRNVGVVPNGKKIISAETMPEYFTKETVQDIRVDTSRDLTLFASVIAPALGITKRFAGSEPLCPITKQYNAGMNDTLPRFGIEFIEFPRLAPGGKAISASAVRKCLERNTPEALKELVPPTTQTFLEENGFCPAQAPR